MILNQQEKWVTPLNSADSFTQLLAQLALLVAEMVNNLLAMQEMQVQSQVPWVGKIPWRSEWQPTPGFLPGESHGQRSLVGYSPWGHGESDTAARAPPPPP